MSDVGEGSIEGLRAKLEEVERENEMLKAAIRASPAGILIASAPDGVIEMWNAAALGIRGADADTLTSIPLEMHPARWHTFHPDGRAYEPGDLPLARALLHGETVRGADVIIRDDDGQERWVIGHAAPVHNEAGELIAGVVVFPDITQRKRAEIALGRFERMAEVSPDVVYMALPDGTITYLNPAGVSMCGCRADALSQVVTADIHPPKVQAQLLREAIPIAIEAGYWQGESEIEESSGERVPVSHVLMAHRNEKGEVAYLSSVMRDLRPLRALESQLRQSQRLESIGRLAGGVAHDFNNLLTVIQNYAILVGRTLPPKDSRRDDLRQVVVASSRATELCAQLLSFARKQIIKPSTIDLGSVIEEMTKLFRRTIGEDITFHTAVAEDLWAVRVDRSQLDQVLLNLVVNARDAMPDGGQLSIEASNEVLDAHYAETHHDVTPGEYVMLSVSDTGSGMTPEVRDNIFEPFFTTKEASKGTGLGLATVYGAVHQNGGHIWLYTEPGDGTCFKIYWPRDRSEFNPLTASESDAIGPGVGTILVVEDEEMLRLLTVRLLESGGYTALSACNGPEAIKLAEAYSGDIDLLLTDIVMPKMNGKELGDVLIGARPNLRVLYVSGYTENTIVHRGVLEAGVEFLAKPFGRDLLLERVQGLLQNS
tara:strand:- start:39088 stop:41052 length:1965 start_codon:yes stop_codon:yes gene_type:complete